MNKDLLFMLDHGEEFIKGVYEASEERIYYISVDELNTFEDIEMLKENVVHIYEENRIEFELLIKNIKADKDLLHKIKNHKSNKLLFRYNDKDFNKLLNLC